jgi:hypothetical protein
MTSTGASAGLAGIVVGERLGPRAYAGFAIAAVGQWLGVRPAGGAVRVG